VTLKKEVTFLKKSNQKTFAYWPPGVKRPQVKEQKFFASFFQKRSACLPFSDSNKTSHTLASFLVLASVLLWGFSPVGTRYMVGINQSALPALAFTGLRYALAAVLFAPFLWRARSWGWRDWRLAGLCGLLGITGFNLPAAIGQRTVSAGLTGLLDGSEPLMIVVIGALLTKRFPGPWTIGASALGLTGIVLLAHGSFPALGDPLGIALVLIGALLWACYCLAVPDLINRQGALPGTAAVMLFGAIPLLAAGAPQTGNFLHQVSAMQSLVFLALVIGSSVLATLCWNAGSAVLGAAQAGWFLYLVPVVSLVGGVLLLGEPVRMIELIGGSLILLSVYLSQR
jgi:drug/metabolite transporter (DMT)-like permease